MRRFSGFLVLVVIIFGNIGGWWLLNRPRNGVPWEGEISSISFMPYRKDDNPFENKFPTPDSIDEDLTLLSKAVGSVRIYNATEAENSQVIPRLAAQHGLRVTAGANLRGAWNNGNLPIDRPFNNLDGDEQKQVTLETEFLFMEHQVIWDHIVYFLRGDSFFVEDFAFNEEMYIEPDRLWFGVLPAGITRVWPDF